MIKKHRQAPLKHVHLGLCRPVDIGTTALSRRHTALNSAFRILHYALRITHFRILPTAVVVARIYQVWI